LSLPQFKLLRPRTLEDATAYLEKHTSNIRVLAGGTDLIPSMRQKLFEPEFVLDIRHIAELSGIRERQGSGIEIGALTTLSDIEHSALLRRRYPVLTEAAATVASRHSLPLVQPIAHLAQGLWVLHKKRR
jgi:CO/xanthine dehydrogenase FAD-binding subunit